MRYLNYVVTQRFVYAKLVVCCNTAFKKTFHRNRQRRKNNNLRFYFLRSIAKSWNNCFCLHLIKLLCKLFICVTKWQAYRIHTWPNIIDCWIFNCIKMGRYSMDAIMFPFDVAAYLWSIELINLIQWNCIHDIK